ncbi:MAG: DEAD/DEAH box helicase [Lentisphaeria bacterium]|nr:DEAD/DEAH box helicase [Lentisphaeria bacterium]
MKLTSVAGRELMTFLAVAWHPLSLPEISRLLSMTMVAKAFPRLSSLSAPKRQLLLAENAVAVDASGETWQGQAEPSEALARDFLGQPQHGVLAQVISQCLNELRRTPIDQEKNLRRDIRNALYAKATDWLKKLCLEYWQNYHPENQYPDIFSFLDSSLDRGWLTRLPAPLLSVCAWMYQGYLLNHLRTSRPLEEVLVARWQELHSGALLHLIDQMILQGRVAEAEQLLVRCDGSAADLRAAWVAFEHGEHQRARQLFESTLDAIRQSEGDKNFYFHTVGGLYYIFSLLRDKSEANLREARHNVFAVSVNPLLKGVFQHLRDLVTRAGGEPKMSTSHNTVDGREGAPPLHRFFHLLISYWLQDCPAALLRRDLEALADQASASQYDAVADTCREMARRLNPNWTPEPTARRHVLIDCVEVNPAWVENLNALDAILGKPATGTDNRLTWHLRPASAGQILPVPMEQRLGRSGKWGKPRPFRSRTASLGWPEHVTPQDMLALAILEHHLDCRAGDENATDEERHGKILEALSGHPLLFWDADAGAAPAPTTIVPARPFCRLRAGEDGAASLALLPEAAPGNRRVARHERDNRIMLYCFTEQDAAVAACLGEGVDLPLAALPQAATRLLKLSRQYLLLSDLQLDCLGLPATPNLSRPVFQLRPCEQGLIVEMTMQPFAELPHRFSPGRGPRELLLPSPDAPGAGLKGAKAPAPPAPAAVMRMVRPIAQEEQVAGDVAAACPALAGQATGPWAWRLYEPERCYDFLLQVQALGERCRVEWPEGETIRMTRQLSFRDARLKTTSHGDWFTVAGEVQVNDQLTITFQHLLRAARDNGDSNYIRLDDGQIVSLADSFRKRLRELAAVCDLHEPGARIHPFALPLANDLLAEAGDLLHDQAWQRRLEAMDRARRLKPDIPTGLKASLRTYQREGYDWLCRLDAWGAGACLADDMGLGKTVQAIALILAKAQEGPALVIAPTSVCTNWRLEFERFAPALEVVPFGPGDRQEVLAGMGPGKVLISSYGLLQSEEDAVARVSWRVAVLDEAQAIKNFNTKRSQAALKLNARFRLATTGTPIENSLDELWSIFHYINPGLLGTRNGFQKRFAAPIEREGDRAMAAHLNALIRPFLLRRNKGQVLRELPDKTEIAMLIDLSEEERAFYEALRRDLVNELDVLRRRNPAQLRFQVLGAITKLRLAVCNPLLVQADSAVSSSKQKAFAELLDELLRNGHKALVFSQFVRHLDLIRPVLEERGVAYHYLDGSTPAPDRAAAVASFQGGSGDVFLISLRAGGLGLNLTAADYVVHLDPWWNPAVENQASDRAHRLGQTKPVTIYRLIGQDTIETKILDLHQRKRRLAEQLLSDHDTPSAVSAEELLKLLQEP